LIYLAWKIATAPPPAAGAPRGKPMTFVQAALFQWINPKGWSMALTAVSAYAVGDSVWSYVVIAVLFGIINLPSIGVWTVLGVQMRRFLDNPRALRAFNIAAALLLVGSLYPTLVGH
jgi:threonine/homoserine/homoserine lactone efflux protein